MTNAKEIHEIKKLREQEYFVVIEFKKQSLYLETTYMNNER